MENKIIAKKLMKLAQTAISPQVVVPVYDHVNLNSTREVSIVTLLIVVHKDKTVVYSTAEILYW